MRTTSQLKIHNSQSTLLPLLPRILLALAILAYAIYFSDLTLTRYYAFEARALDLGNFDQAIWNTAHGRWFHLTNQQGIVNRLSLHVEPILIPISWLYWIHSGPETLLVLQSIVVASGALPLFAFGCLKLQREKWGGEWLALTFAVAFLLNPSMQAANWLEFHAVTLAPTFILAALYFLHAERPGWFALFAILAASCKEEIALLIFMIGLYALFVLRQRRLGIITMALALTWAFLAVFVIQNFFAAGNIHWGRYAYLGDGPLQMVTALLTQPGTILAQLQAANALSYVLRMLIPVALLALPAPELLLLALPSLAINLLADFSPMHQVDTLIYAAPIVPFVMVAGVVGAERLLGWVAGLREEGKKKRARVATLLLMLLTGTFSVVNNAFYGYLPWGGNYLPLTVTEHHRNAAEIIAQIPPQAKVSAQDRLNPHVSSRETVYWFPRVDDADTIFLDVVGPAWPQHPSDLRQSVDALLESGFAISAARDGYLLLQKNAPEEGIIGREIARLPDAFYSAWHEPNFVPQNDVDILFGDALRLRDVRVGRDRYGELVVSLFWQMQKPIEREIRFQIAYLDEDWNELHSSQFYPPTATLWYPTTLWKMNNGLRSVDVTGSDTGAEAIVVQTLPWTLEAERFTLLLGLYEAGDSGNELNWQRGKRLPITQEEPRFPVHRSERWVRLGGYEKSAAGEWQKIALDGSTPSAKLDARFGEAIVLEGVDITQNKLAAGESLDFTLHWRSVAPKTTPMEEEYTAFVHLLDAEDNLVAQLDWQPHDRIGRLPTSMWRTGVPVVDSQQLPLPATLPPGEYRLIGGLYRLSDGVRLPVDGTDARPGDVVEIAVIQIE